MRIRLEKTFEGRILDIGGGGEGVIGRLYGRQVTAIDNRQDELDEAPDGFAKLLMDARNLAFADGSFDHATFFYALMYMDESTKATAICEAARVLRSGGCLHIWDADIICASPEPFIVALDIALPNEQIHTSYGVLAENAAQNRESVAQLCRSAGLIETGDASGEDGFCLSFIKP